MSAESNAIDDATAMSPGIAQAIKNVVRFHDIQPNSAPSSGGNTRPISLYKYTDKAQSDFVKGAPAAVASGELRLTTGVGNPGEGAPLHDHTAEELMFIASGSWVVFSTKQKSTRSSLSRWTPFWSQRMLCVDGGMSDRTRAVF